MMDEKRYNQILEAVQKIQASVGDIPTTGAAGIIQDRIRHFTDDHAKLKEWASDIRVELNKVTKALSALRSSRRILFKQHFEAVELEHPAWSQTSKKEEADDRCAVEDAKINQYVENLGDLETLQVVVENRLDAIKVSTSNLRKEWETMVCQQHTDEAAEKIRRQRATVEEAVSSAVLDLGESDPKATSGVQTQGSKPSGESVDDLLGEFGKP